MRRVSASRAMYSASHVSATAGRNIHGSMLAKFSDDAILLIIVMYPQNKEG